MNASTVVVTAVLGAGVLIDLPGLRYEAPLVGEPGPIERDLRWYGLRESESSRNDWHSGGGMNLPPEWREQVELWDGVLREGLEHESAAETPGMVPLWGREKSAVARLLDGQSAVDLALILSETIDPALPLLYGDYRRDGPNREDATEQRSSALPADFNHDSKLTLADLDAYSAAFAANAPRADLNRDGQIDAQDLRSYLDTFDANYRP